jgi:hypothetical protein
MCTVEDMNQEEEDQSINKNTNMSLSNKLNQFEKSLTARLNTEEAQCLFTQTFRYKKDEE